MAPGRQHEPRRRARRRALQALYQWHLNPCGADGIIEQFYRQQDFSNVDVPWFRALVEGVVDSAGELDQRLQAFLDRPLAHLDVMERVVLQIGAWELLNRPEVPMRVVLDEAIDLARRFGAEQGHSFVNAVLDQAARQWRADEFLSTPSTA